MNEPSRAAWRIGVFAVTGVAVLLAAIVVVGGRVFAPTESAVMVFRASVWGLQVGAPVVLRGVRVGEVSRIGLAPADVRALPHPSAHWGVPVTATFDAARLRELLGPGATGAVLPMLVERGLVARLSTQSLLTGLLYVDLDLDLAAAAPRPESRRDGKTLATTAGGPGPPVTIPTGTTRLQALQAQLEGLDLNRLVQDLGAAAQSLKAFSGGAEIRLALQQVTRAAVDLSRLSQQVQAEAAPSGAALRETLEQVRRTAAAVEPLARDAQTAAQQVTVAAVQASALALAGQPLVADVRRSAEELARTAQALQRVVAEDSSLRRQADTALSEIGRAAVAMRELAQLLEQHPESLLRGRPK